MMNLYKSVLSRLRGLPTKLHHDQSGSISIVSVFAVIFLAMVFGMVMNIGRHADRKVKMQHAADAATYSGGVVLARSMNTMVFTNHLLADVFALTAYLREARDQTTEPMAEQVLQAWETMAPTFQDAPLTKFSNLAIAIPLKTPLERNLISVFGNQNAAVAEQLLPVMEDILEFEMIPEFQRALWSASPRLATMGAAEIAALHGPFDAGLSGGTDMQCMLWRTDGMPFGSEAEFEFSTLPVADPIYDTTEFQPVYFMEATGQRSQLAFRYLNQLNNTMLPDLDRVAKMSQFSRLWRGVTCGYLGDLLNEHPDRNLPMQLRRSQLLGLDPSAYVEEEYLFVGVTYWNSMPERLPGLFGNPINNDDVTFAQFRLFIPRNRLVYDPTRPIDYQVYRLGRHAERDLINQSWTVQLVPATTAALPDILQTQPFNDLIEVPDLGGINVDDFRRLNTH
jgi:hypothetical protein